MQDVRERQAAEKLAAENKEEIEEEVRPTFTSGRVRTRRLSSFSSNDGESKPLLLRSVELTTISAFLSRGRTGVGAVYSDMQVLAGRVENLSQKLQEEIALRLKLEEMVAALG